MNRTVTEVPKFVIGDPQKAQMSVDMNRIVGSHDIVFYVWIRFAMMWRCRSRKTAVRLI